MSRVFAILFVAWLLFFNGLSTLQSILAQPQVANAPQTIAAGAAIALATPQPTARPLAGVAAPLVITVIATAVPEPTPELSCVNGVAYRGAVPQMADGSRGCGMWGSTQQDQPAPQSSEPMATPAPLWHAPMAVDYDACAAWHVPLPWPPECGPQEAWHAPMVARP